MADDKTKHFSNFDEAVEFVQPVGILYVWAMEVCDLGSAGSVGRCGYLEVAPHQPFAVRALSDGFFSWLLVIRDIAKLVSVFWISTYSRYLYP